MRLFVWVSDSLNRSRSVLSRHRKLLWIMALVLVAGIAVGIWLGCVSQREYQPVWALIVVGAWRPFATWGRALLLMLAGLAVFYLSLRFRYRGPYFVFVFAHAYLWGRLSALSVVAGGAEGAISVVILIPLFCLCLFPSLWLLLTTLDVTIYSLWPPCNKPILRRMLWAAALGTLTLFVYVVVILGLVNACINLV